MMVCKKNLHQLLHIPNLSPCNTSSLLFLSANVILHCDIGACHGI